MPECYFQSPVPSYAYSIPYLHTRLYYTLRCVDGKVGKKYFAPTSAWERWLLWHCLRAKGTFPGRGKQSLRQSL